MGKIGEKNMYRNHKRASCLAHSLPTVTNTSQLLWVLATDGHIGVTAALVQLGSTRKSAPALSSRGRCETLASRFPCGRPQRVNVILRSSLTITAAMLMFTSFKLRANGLSTSFISDIPCRRNRKNRCGSWASLIVKSINNLKQFSSRRFQYSEKTKFLSIYFGYPKSLPANKAPFVDRNFFWEYCILHLPAIHDLSTRRKSTLVTFQHLWPVSPNGALGFSERLKIQTFDHTAPILLGFLHRRPVTTWSRVLVYVQP
ncbi:hypothetical protein AVEN_89169-1 [Araneus ventricosus]|uniref:Uncharacterized protein n=1 Tax=Araneus ventricosus TaxID=182803 RepID=A0A4Y2B507_ARAVE|nr:hypothetical protein AVEN_89169-1 [Araneus ventricosus]